MPDTYIELVGNWRGVARGLKRAIVSVQEVQLLAAAGFAKETKDTAQHFLDVYVYNAPLPASAATDPHYLDRFRTGRTRGAIKSEVHDHGLEVVAKVYVDPSDFPRFRYYLSLEFGLASKPNYYPRPFWRSTKAVMKVRYRAEGKALLRELRTRIGRGFV